MQFKECYQNPFIEERADPYITKGPDGFYYFTASYPMKSADMTVWFYGGQKKYRN